MRSFRQMESLWTTIKLLRQRISPHAKLAHVLKHGRLLGDKFCLKDLSEVRWKHRLGKACYVGLRLIWKLRIRCP